MNTLMFTAAAPMPEPLWVPERFGYVARGESTKNRKQADPKKKAKRKQTQKARRKNR